MWRKWMPSRIWWRTISAASTPLNTRPRIRRWTTPSGRSASPPRLRAIEPCARAAATTLRPTPRRRPSNDPHPVASLARLPAVPVAQSVPALAHRDLLGAARRRDHVRAVLEFRVAAAARTGALPPLGGADELAACCCCFESGGNPPAP